MKRPTTRARQLLALLAGTASLLFAAGCGSSGDTNTATTDPSSAAGLPEPGAAGASSSTDLVALAECFEVNSDHFEFTFIQGEDPEILYGEDFGANAPDDIVREAVAAGGWLHADVTDGQPRIGQLDVFEFATEGAATAAIPKIENGREPGADWRYGDSNHAVQDGTILFVLDKPYDERQEPGRHRSLDVPLSKCLPRTSAIRFTSPAGDMSYSIEVPR
jgi:hypothetical protein